METNARRIGLKAAALLRKQERDSLNLFRALPHQTPIFESVATELGIIGGNRSGKSTTAAVRFASIARNKPVFDSRGREHNLRLPHQRNRKLLMWVIGLDWEHLGKTIWRLLFEHGLFKVILDEDTKKWRAFDPTNPRDAARELQARP
ncbi:MAG: hypothetical protein AAF394_19300, partial [Planctomycetota bacterium]